MWYTKKAFHITYLFWLILFVKGVQLNEDGIIEQIKEDLNNIVRNVAVSTKTVFGKKVTKDQVNFFLYTRSSPNKSTLINDNNLDIFTNTESLITFLIHGWLGTPDLFFELKDAFLSRFDKSYVIMVDWRKPATHGYFISSLNTEEVSKFIVELIIKLMKNWGVHKERIWLVGHSLGAHVCGYCGKQFQKATSETLSRIIGLDPAGPIFSTRPEVRRLNRMDADVVQIIHTDALKFGFQKAIGTIDFFPNGGYNQPGCFKIWEHLSKLDVFGLLKTKLKCNHNRSIELLIEALLHPTHFLATRCISWFEYKYYRQCKNGLKVPMGNFNEKLVGKFYFETNDKPPFSKPPRSENWLPIFIGK